MRQRYLHVAWATLLIVALAATGAAPVQARQGGEKPPREQREVLRQYAADTWRSFVMLTDETTGLPADNVSAEGLRSAYTSPTNIGTYLWSTIAARELGIIKPREARERIAQTLASVATLERHAQSGMFYNWYNPATGAKLTVWPADGSKVLPFLSSVDNGWLAAALFMVADAAPQQRAQALAIADSMDFGFYYDPAAGLLRGGFWDDTAPAGCVQANYRGGDPVCYTGHHYGSLNTEPRIASYIAIAKDGVPGSHYFKMWRTFPADCGWNWQEMQPEGVTRTYEGVDVFEGHYTYAGLNLVPSWGGSMFEALMVPLLVPEEQWGPRSWGVNHPLYVEAQIYHGMSEAEYGYWGFSPSNNPAGGYREYGVDPLGLEPNGYTSDQERTLVDYGFGDCPGREGQSIPGDYGDGVVTPHASFLALDFAREAALANLEQLRDDFDDDSGDGDGRLDDADADGIYGAGGFYDAVAVESGQVSRYYLALDQGMIMAAIANELTGDRFQRHFSRTVQAAVRPLLAQEEFTAGRAK